MEFKTAQKKSENARHNLTQLGNFRQTEVEVNFILMFKIQQFCRKIILIG